MNDRPPRLFFIINSRNQKSWIGEKSLLDHIDSVAYTFQIPRVVRYCFVNLALHHLPIGPVWKMTLWVSPPTPLAVFVITKRWNWGQLTFELYGINP